MTMDPARIGRSALQSGPQSLGWLSVGLGLGGLLMPRTMGRLTGLQGSEGLIRAVGARELAAGAGLLSQRKKTPWLWARVAGDALDLALLALSPVSRYRTTERAVSTAVVAAITAADIAAALGYREEEQAASQADQDVYLERSIIINKTPRECYDFWRDLRNVPRFTRNLENVTPLDDRHSHWVTKSFAGQQLEWRARINDDVPGERILWSATGDTPFRHAGSVNFAPATGGRGTLVTVGMHYRTPGGSAGAALAKFLGPDPLGEVRESLRRLKQLLETGEIPTTVGQPSGRRSLFGRLMPEGRKSRQPHARPSSVRYQAEGRPS